MSLILKTYSAKFEVDVLLVWIQQSCTVRSKNALQIILHNL